MPKVGNIRGAFWIKLHSPPERMLRLVQLQQLNLHPSQTGMCLMVAGIELRGAAITFLRARHIAQFLQRLPQIKNARK